MPRQIANDDDMPRRRRGASAVAVEAEAERGLVMRILLHSPKDMVAGVLAFAAVSAIIANALFLQAGRHPSPMFGSVVAMPAAGLAPASPLPRPRPVEADDRSRPRRRIETCRAQAGRDQGCRAEGRRAQGAEPKARSAANLVKATSRRRRHPLSRGRRRRSRFPRRCSPRGSRRVAAVQRALTEYGYGQLKPTGTIGSDTQAAIQKFERERKMPVTGQMSDRLVRELAAMIGHPIE